MAKAPEDDTVALFNLEKDPGEKNSVAEAMADFTAEIGAWRLRKRTDSHGT